MNESQPDSSVPSRDELASLYLDQLEYDPYPVQEEALLAWFEDNEGVLVCAPTGTGKTLIAEAALFEALHTRKRAYYTTPLIALTDQKFQELQDSAEKWGFVREDVGLVTGNRCVNPEAIVLVVVAEVLLNRLLHGEMFRFDDVTAVVMDEFHSFNDPERGIVWELSLALLPRHVRLLLLSATVGNTAEFLLWLRKSHKRKLQLVQSSDRKVPLRFHWVGDELLNEFLERISGGEEEDRRTPALLFCFNREQCWSVAEQLKGKHLVSAERRKELQAEIEKHDWSPGAGPKLKQIVQRGVGVHHAGMMPRYRRIVEDLFQRKLLAVTVCTETLAAGINLPARSVILTTLMKGPPGDRKLVDASSAHQMFGRAGRPQFDCEGYVYVLAHEDDVKIARWQAKYDSIPEDTKDAGLRNAKKKLKKKMPTRRKNEQYWNEQQFEKLVAAPPGRLSSRGHFPWRLLAYLLTLSPHVDRLRDVVSRRLLGDKWLKNAQKQLTNMLLTLWAGGYVKLDPEPPANDDGVTADTSASNNSQGGDSTAASDGNTIGALLSAARDKAAPSDSSKRKPESKAERDEESETQEYVPHVATPTESLERLLGFRSMNPLLGVFMADKMAIAAPEERIQLFESVLEMPGSVAKLVRVPRPEEMSPGPLATEFLDQSLIERGLVTFDELYPNRDEYYEEGPRFPIPLADKLRMLFDSEFPRVHSLRTCAVWAAGDGLQFGGDFNKYISGRGLAKQEGVLFRHFLRLILLLGEFSQITPVDCDEAEWQEFLRDLGDSLTEVCLSVDPDSTSKTLEGAASVPDLVQGESTGE